MRRNFGLGTAVTAAFLLVSTVWAETTSDIVTPSSGSALTSGSTEFTLSNSSDIVCVCLYVGSTQGQNDVADSGTLGVTSTLTVSGLPADSRTLYVRLWYGSSSVWAYHDYQYTAASATTATAISMTSPVNGSTLTESSVTFSWTAGTDLLDSWLYVGSGQGQGDIVNSGSLGTATTFTANGLPTDGRSLFVRLWYRNASGWAYVDLTYVAATQTTTTTGISSPAPGSTLTGSSVTFSWTQPTEVLENWLYVGSRRGGTDLFNSKSLGIATTCAVTGLPTNGRLIFVRWWYRTPTKWNAIDYAYKGALITATMTSPAPGSTLTGSSVTFSWTQPAEILENWLTIGSRRGRSDVFNSGSLGLATSSSVSTIPTDGRPLSVKLWYRTAAGWACGTYNYRTAFAPPVSLLGTETPQ